MCSEIPPGLPAESRKIGRWLMLMAAIAGALVLFARQKAAQAVEPAELRAPTPNSPDEPLAKVFTREKAGEFLDAVALDWTRKRDCGACHTNYAYMIGRPALGGKASSAMLEIREFFEDRVTHWDDAEKSSKPRWDAEVVATACTLALNDAATTGTLHPKTRQALDRAWTLQKSDGSFNWLKCNWPPFEHDDYFGAAFAAVGVGSAPDGYAKTESAVKGIEKLRSYLTSTPAPDLHHKTFLLWASTRLDGLMTAPDRAATIQSLRALQHADGGWGLPSLGAWKRHDGSENPKDAPSDGYATGLIVYVLRQAGVPSEDAALKSGVSWLKTHQRASRRWFTRSLNQDKAHYITNAGSSFAVMALQACGAE